MTATTENKCQDKAARVVDVSVAFVPLISVGPMFSPDAEVDS